MAVIPQITVIDRIRLLEHVSILPILSMKNISEGIKLILAV